MAYGPSQQGGIAIQWPDEKLNRIKDAVTQARKKREQIADEYDWKGNRERYVPKPQKLSDGTVTYDVNVGADFRDVERKKAALLYDTPAISLLPDEPSRPVMQAPQGQQVPTMGSLVSIHQELLNGLLGPRHANAKAVMLKALFDVLCPAGVGVFKVGYEVRSVSVEAPQFDPMGQPVINPVTGQPLTQPQEVPIWERWFLTRVSPMGLLLPADFKDTDHTLSPWIGYDYCLPASAAKRLFQMPDEWKPKGADAKKPYFDAEDEQKYTADDPPVIVTYIEYKAEQYADPGQDVHPEQINQICFVDGEVVKHQPHPDQSIDKQSARLTLDSINTFSVQTLTLRDYSDSAWVASDSTVTGALTREINRFRTQFVQLRDGQRIIMAYNPALFDPAAKDKVIKAEGVVWVPLPDDAFDGAGNQRALQQITTPSMGRDNLIGQDYIERDRDRILGMEQNQTGSTTPTKRTATELTLVQRNSEARFEQERQRVLECYLRLVRIFDTLVLRYCDERNAALILGPVKGKVWAQFKQALLGGYHYEIQTDAGKYMDVEAERRTQLQLYNLVAKDPNANRIPVLKKVFQAHGYDPAECVVEQLPEPKPEPPKINFAVASADLNPALPQFPLVVQLLRQGGIDLGFTDVQLAQMQAQMLAMVGRSPVTAEQETTQTPDPSNPLQTIEQLSGPSQVPTAGVGPDPKQGRPESPEGPAEPADRLNKHQLDLTGGISGPGPM